MRALPWAFCLFFSSIVSVSLSSPLPVVGRSSSTPPNAYLQMFNTGSKPNHHRIRRTTPTATYKNHRHIKISQRRDVPPPEPAYTKIFWAFGDSEPVPSDLLPVQDALASMAVGQQQIMTSATSMVVAIATSTSTSTGTTLILSSQTQTQTTPTNSNSLIRTPTPTPHFPLSVASASATSSSTRAIQTPMANKSNPATTAALAHKHKIIFASIVLGIITGLGITIGACQLFARSGMCDCGGREFTGAGQVVVGGSGGDDGNEKGEGEGGKEREKKMLSWMKLSGAPSNFGMGSFMAGVGTRGGNGMFGRRYDDKGIERNPHRKVVSFEDEEDAGEKRVVDIRPEFVEPDLLLRSLAYHQPPTGTGTTSTSNSTNHKNNFLSTSAKSNNRPGNPRALGLKVGQTLRPAHFTTHHLSPTSFFDNDDDQREQQSVVSASPSRVSNISTIHSRTKSAPMTIGNGIGNRGRLERRDSDKSSAQSSSASSEWDIARAYGGPRYEKARSAGAMSGVLMVVDERDWERIQMIRERG